MEQSEHTQHLPVKFAILYGYGSWCPKTITIVTSAITDHHNNIIIMKVLKYCKNYQDVTQRHKVSNAAGKMMLIDLLDAGLPQTFNL